MWFPLLTALGFLAVGLLIIIIDSDVKKLTKRLACLEDGQRKAGTFVTMIGGKE